MNWKFCALLLLTAGLIGPISGCDKPKDKGTAAPAQPPVNETPAQAPTNTTDSK